MDQAGQEGFTTWVRETNGVIRPRAEHEYVWFSRYQTKIFNNLQRVLKIDFNQKLEHVEQQLLLKFANQYDAFDQAKKLCEHYTEGENAIEQVKVYTGLTVQLQAEKLEAQKLLETYGQHLPECKVFAIANTGRLRDVTCNCGWLTHNKIKDDAE